MPKKMKIITFAAPDELVKALEAASKQEYIPISVLIRTALLKAFSGKTKKEKEHE